MRTAPMWSLFFPLALAAIMTACGGSSSRNNNPPVVALFEPAPLEGTPTLPYPNDLLFAGFDDPTLNIPNPGGANPLVAAANLTDGFSTTAPLFTDLSGAVDFQTAAQGILVIDSSTGAPLVAGEDIRITDYPPTLASTGDSRSRIQIKPLKPLKPSTRYLVVITEQLRNLDGLAAEPSDQFRIVRSATPVSDQDDAVAMALDPAQQAVLEQVRSQQVRPAVQAVLGAVPSLSEAQIVLAWTFTTQNISATFASVDADADARTAVDHPQSLAILAAPSGQDTSAIGAPPVADIFVGAADLPYFLQAPTDAADAVIRQTFFAADETQPDTRTDSEGQPIVRFLGQVPCEAFALGGTLPDGQTAQASLSTTACFPVPVERSVQRVPLLVTVPNAASGQTRPASGWPVVIFQHGITRNRTDALPVAPALAAAGFVVVAIDLPLHGIVAQSCEPTDALCLGQQAIRGANALSGASERTFDIDLDGDGLAEDSGAYFTELTSLATARDNLRQGVTDLLHLTRLVTRLNLDAEPAPDIDPDRIHFVGHSLGGIVGTTALGVTDQIGAVSIVASGGGIARLLDGSRSFGPVIAGQLSALAGIEEGTDDYESFLRFSQHLIDDADPINYAAAAANRPFHFIEVIGDLVVPNTVVRSAGSETQDRAVTAGPLSGSTPLIEQLGLQVLDPITPPLAMPDAPLTGATLKVAVRFAIGDHGSVLDPTSFPAVTQEMQRQIANFLASQGTCLPLGGNCTAP